MRRRYSASQCVVLAFLVVAFSGPAVGQSDTNTVLGTSALNSNTSGVHNVAIGYQALFNNTEGYFNVANGSFTLHQNVLGDFNVATGAQALRLNVGDMNTATGALALESNLGGNENVANGYLALHDNSGGSNNVAVGSHALYANQHGTGNVAVGRAALYQGVTGSSNTAIGAGAMQNGIGNGNTALGGWALASIAGEGNVAVGESAGSFAGDGSFNIFLGAAVYGNSDDTHTIRIGAPYGPWAGSYTSFSGQNKTYVAGIVETPLTSDYSVVGVQPDGRLGTLEPEQFRGEEGPPGPSGLPGAGFVRGSLLIMLKGITPPPGFALLGTTQLVLKAANGKSSAVQVSVYQMQ